MRYSKYLWAPIFGAFITGAPLTTGLAAQGVRPDHASIAEQYLFSAANMERTSRGLPALHWNPRLAQAARYHANQMAAHRGISHRFSGEPELAARGAEAGAKFSKVAENVAEAPSAVTIHDMWMHSEGHRENLLDGVVDSVGIAVVNLRGQLYAVEDFDRDVQQMRFAEQETAIGGLVQPYGLSSVLLGQPEARETCRKNTGYAGQRRPLFVMRFTASDLNQLPDALKSKMRSGQYREASIGACPATGGGNFTAYNIAVLLYP